MSPAQMRPPPATSNRILPARSDWARMRIRLTLRSSSITSSLTPGITVYSWTTSSILTQVMALPVVELNRIRRKGLPMVRPKPRCNGSTATFP